VIRLSRLVLHCRFSRGAARWSPGSETCSYRPDKDAGVEVPVTVRPGLPSWLTRVLDRRPHLAFLRDLAISGIEFAPFAVRHQALPL